MPSLDVLHTLFAIATSLAMFVAVWWKVSLESKANKAAIALNTEAIEELKLTKTDIAVTAKLISAIEKIEHDLISHHTDFKAHRNEDSERRMSDLMSTVTDLAKENRADHQTIMTKLGRLERLDEKS